MAEASGFPYPDLSDPLIECVLVVADDSGQTIMACGAKRLVELYLWVQPGQRPAAVQAAIRLLHKEMAAVLRKKGYNSAEAYLPPSIAAKFGQRLEKVFGWVRNWPSWTKDF